MKKPCREDCGVPCIFSCRDCGEVHPRIFMVHDEVWEGEAGLPARKCLLCMTCFEKILARPLVEADFTVAPCNWWPGFGTPLRSEPDEDEIRVRFSVVNGYKPDAVGQVLRYAEELKAGRVA